MRIIDWLRKAAKDIKDADRLRSERESCRLELLRHRDRIYEMVTGDTPSIWDVRRNGHEEYVKDLDNILHDRWAFYWIGGRPETVYSVNQILRSGEIRTVMSNMPHKFDAEHLQMLLIVLDKKEADCEIIEDATVTKQ